MYWKYAGIMLSDAAKIYKVDNVIIPNRVNNSIDIPSRHGSIYNGFKYATRKIKVLFSIRCAKSEYEENVNAIASSLDIVAPSRLYIGDNDKYYYAVPEGDVKLEKLNDGMSDGEISFICYEPFAYSDINHIYQGANSVTVFNNGTADAYPILKTNFTKDSHFAQFTNAENGKAILIGQWPSVNQSSNNLAGIKLNDDCKTTTNWLNAGNVVDSDRLVQGGITINSGGYGLKASNFGTTVDQKWHGPCVRRNIGTNIRDFEVVATFEHDSKGKNISDSANTPPSTEVNSVEYKTTHNLNIRSDRGTTHKILATIPKGTVMKVTDISSGWGKVTWNNYTGYCSMQYLALIAPINVTHKVNTVSGKGLNMRSGRGTSNKIILSVPNGTQLEVSDISSGWGKSTYKGSTGYLFMDYLAPVNSSYSVNSSYDYVYNLNEEETADDKLGLIELYGFDSAGQKLFKFMLADTNEYYEFTYPEVQIGNNVVLAETSNAPAPITKVEKDDKGEETITKELSGKFGKWNEFFGNIRIKRETISNKQQWYCEVNKLSNGTTVQSIKSSTMVSDSYPKGDLNHLILYIGAYKDKKQVEMTLTSVIVNQLNTVPPTVNAKIFKNGDELEIDCSTNMVYLNNEHYMQHVDIGSQFFNISPGKSNIKVHSDDTEIYSTVTLVERWL